MSPDREPPSHRAARGPVARPSWAKRTLVAALGLVLIGAGRPIPTAAAPAIDALQSGPTRYDYAGLIHLHTAWSDDATGTYASLATDAGRQGIRFLIVTDHNTLRPIRDGVQGWHGGVLMLTGVENSRPEGHMLGLNITSAPTDGEAPTAPFLSSLQAEGGLAVIAHPTHRKWAWKGLIDDRFMGMEILDLADQFYDAPATAKTAAIAALPFRPIAAYLELGGRPASALAKWDQITRTRRFVGLYAPDIHQAIELSDDWKIAFPPARDIMRIARDHIVTPAPFTGRQNEDASLVYDALRAGHVFVSLDVLGDGTGFMFTGERPGQTAWMGDQIVAGPPTTYRVRLPASAAPLKPVIHLLRNGTEVARTAPGDAELAWASGDDGVYRVEVTTRVPTLAGRPREMIWIYSNPIYARAG